MGTTVIAAQRQNFTSADFALKVTMMANIRKWPDDLTGTLNSSLKTVNCHLLLWSFLDFGDFFKKNMPWFCPFFITSYYNHDKRCVCSAAVSKPATSSSADEEQHVIDLSDSDSDVAPKGCHSWLIHWLIDALSKCLNHIATNSLRIKLTFVVLHVTFKLLTGPIMYWIGCTLLFCFR